MDKLLSILKLVAKQSPKLTYVFVAAAIGQLAIVFMESVGDGAISADEMTHLKASISRIVDTLNLP